MIFTGKIELHLSAQERLLIINSAHDTVIPAQGKVVVPTDISLAIPPGHYGRVAPRSGLASKHHLDTGAGVIDADYRGPLGILMFNFSKEDYKGNIKVGFFFFLRKKEAKEIINTWVRLVSRGDRIAQLILEKISVFEVEEVEVCWIFLFFLFILLAVL
jgi:dUTP pyrophosphatase